MSRLNLRKRKGISYYEPEEPNLDEYIFCSDCGDYVYEYCAIHGPLLVIPDDKVPVKSPYPPCVPRSALTIPHVFLHIAPSNIPGAGLGVFSSLTLPRGVRFGPYRGTETYDASSDYSWQIHDGNNKRSHYVDAEDANNSNWMRFVNCSRHSVEQNLVAYQYKGMIYYRTIGIIPKFTELLVFYGGEFAHRLNIDLKKYNSPIGYAQILGTINLQKLPLMKEKAKEVLQVDKDNTCEKPNITTPQDKPKERNEIIIKDSTSNKRNKFNEESNNTDKISKNTKKTKKNEPRKKRQKNSPFTNSNNKIKAPDTTNIPKKYYQSEIITHGESKPANNINVLPKTSTINSKLNDNIYDSNLLVSRNKYICNICNYETKKKNCLVSHLRLHDTKGKIHFCSHCKYMTNKNNNLDNHLKIHTGDKPHNCNICHRKFSLIIHLKSHIRTHTGEKPHECNICHRKFSHKISLNSHIRTHTGEKPHECNICHRKFSHKISLNSHIRTHTGEKPHECNICHRKFSQNIHLKYHIRTHTGEKPHECNICHRKFSRNITLKFHIRTHTGEKPHECNICHRKFSQNIHLKSHIRTHTGEKPHECNICHRKFSQNIHLKSHIRTHTGEKPHECNICHRKFSHKISLNSHIRTHTGEKPYACHLCKKKFTQRSSLNTHLRTHKETKIIQNLD